jgi:hypothetical protein
MSALGGPFYPDERQCLGRFETGGFVACDLPFRFQACRSARRGSERHRMVEQRLAPFVGQSW